jgi:glutamate-5-semialdehyde dehydrogenase
MTGPDAATAVTACGRAAKAAAPHLAAAPAEAVDAALHAMATLLGEAAPALLAANTADIAAGEAGGLGRALLDRLALGEARIAEMARQISLLAATGFPPGQRRLRELPDGFFLAERRVPVGVIGANYEARPDVTVDVASQLLKSRNAGVLRTGAAALRSAVALFDHVIAPALTEAGLDADALQLVRSADRQAAVELVSRPGLTPLVIFRSSGDTTRSLAAEAARHGVRTLAHADGGGVLYLDRAADPALAAELITGSLDRLGVCNRLNLLLVHAEVWDQMVGVAEEALRARGVAASMPPHDHPLGHEWALDAGREATVTVAPAHGPAHAAAIANQETSGLAASVVTADPDAAREFLDAYAGTGAFWNASTRLLDGFKLRGVPETGINVDHVPGPRGPVTFEDLCLRQYVITPAGYAGDGQPSAD